MVARDVGLDMLRSAVERNLLRDERPLLLDELQISSSNIGAQGGGVDALKHLLGLSPDLPATIKCRYNDVKVPAETFRIITVQDLAKLHHNLDDMAKICPPDLVLEGFEWRARPLDRRPKTHSWAMRCNTTRSTPPPAPCYVLYVLYGPQPAPLSPSPCYMCICAIWVLQGKPLPGPMLYVLYVLYGSYKASR